MGRVDIALKINRYCTIRFKLFWYTWIWYKHIVIVGIFIWERNIIRRLDHSFHKQIFIAYNRNKIYASYICHYSFQNHGSLKPWSFVGRVFTCTHREINSLNLFIVNYHIFSKEIAVTFQILHLYFFFMLLIITLAYSKIKYAARNFRLRTLQSFISTCDLVMYVLGTEILRTSLLLSRYFKKNTEN